MIPGGYANMAGGSGSFAAGSYAQATNTGAFVWSDVSTASAFNSTGTNQFLIRASGGVGIGTNNPTAALQVVGHSPTNIALRIDNGGIAVSGAGKGSPTAAFIVVSASTNIFYSNAVQVNNPLCNNHPDAILLITHNTSAQTLYQQNNHPLGIWYDGSHWEILNEDTATMQTNLAFNVLVINP